MKKLACLFILLSSYASAQVNADSLMKVFANEKLADSSRLLALESIIWDVHLYSNPDSSLHYSKMYLAMAEEKKLLSHQANALNLIGVVHTLAGSFEEAISYYKQSIAISEKEKDYLRVSKTLNNLTRAYLMTGQEEEALASLEKSLELRMNLKDSIGVVFIYDKMGMTNSDIAKYDEAIKCFEAGMKLLEKLDDLELEANIYAHIGDVYSKIGDYDKASKYYRDALQNAEKLGDTALIAGNYNNIAVVYQDQNEFDLALKYLTKSYEMHKAIGNSFGVSVVSINIGVLHSDRGDHKEAIKRWNESLAFLSSSGELHTLATVHNNLGMSHWALNNNSKAIEHLNKALDIRSTINDMPGVSSSSRNLGKIYMDQAKYSAALDMFNKAYRIAEQINAKIELRDAAFELYQYYDTRKQAKEALSYYKLYVSTRDSIKSEANQKEVIRQEYKYQYEKQATADSIKSAEKGKVKDAQLAAERAESRRNEIEANQQKEQKYYLYGGLALALLFGGFIFNRFRVTSKQKGIIEEQKSKVDEAYNELEEKNTEILDSINYAKRIQSAILPPHKLVKEYLKQSFVLYKPKDIVAGDFYWMEQKDGKILFAAADCTGHGVPGAMVSVVCNNGLNRSVREHGLTNPGKILDKTREIVIREFEKSEEDVKDGMDIALCSLSGAEGKQVLEYAGAHNPLWIIRAGAKDVEEIKANKQPIGKYDGPLPYTSHRIELNEGDSFYIFSDGYVDQFGGDKGKKLKSKNFKELLLSIQAEDMERQKVLIDEAFEKWKGGFEQLDDVCVIGVRI